MKNRKKYIVIVLVFAALLAGSVYAYGYLSDRYRPEDAAPDNSKASSQTAAAQQAIDFTVQDMNGKQVNLSDFFGKPIVLNFWATWCGPCRSEFPAFERLYHTYQDDLVFLMVNLTDGYRDTAESVKTFLDAEGYSFPVYLDTEYEAAYAYNVSSIPLTVFIDAQGGIVDGHIGAMEKETLKNYIQNLLGGAQ